MITTIHRHRPLELGVRIQYPADSDAHAVRSWDQARNALLRLHHQHGYLWIERRIRTNTREVDPTWSREDQTWNEATHTFHITRLERVVAPLVKRARWAVSMWLAARAYDTGLHSRAKANPTGWTARFHDAVVRARRTPNVLDDGELYARLHVPIHEYFQERR